jgi:thiamine monophosphate synthase
MTSRCLLCYITDRTAFPGDESSRRRRLLEKISEAARVGVDYIQLREKDLSTRDLESLAHEAVSLIAKLRSENRQLRTALLINSRTDVALATGADGVHLRSDDISPQEVRAIWEKSRVGTAAKACSAYPQPAGPPKRDETGVPHFSPPLREVGVSTEGSRTAHSAGAIQSPALTTPLQTPLIGVSCHSPAEVAQAAVNGATFAVFAPVFEKKDVPTTAPAGLVLLQEACKARIPVLALGGITLENARSCLEAGAAGIAAIRLFQENDVAKIVDSLRQLIR